MFDFNVAPLSAPQCFCDSVTVVLVRLFRPQWLFACTSKIHGVLLRYTVAFRGDGGTGTSRVARSLRWH